MARSERECSRSALIRHPPAFANPEITVVAGASRSSVVAHPVPVGDPCAVAASPRRVLSRAPRDALRQAWKDGVSARRRLK